jgi:tetratricopeptide (TPR) repeat protein
MKERSQITRYRRLRRLDEGPYIALTILEARAYASEYPEDSRGWTLLGRNLAAVARYEEAEQALAKALACCPVDRREYPLGQLGHLFAAQGDLEQAAGYYELAIEAAPDDADWRVFLGRLRIRQGRLIEAEEVFGAASRCTQGEVCEAHFGLGMVHRAMERFEAAAESFAEALRLDPDDLASRRALRDVKRCRMRKPRRRRDGGDARSEDGPPTAEG